MKTFARTLLAPLFALCLASLMAAPVQAQSVDVGADIVNRYVWRGTDFGNAAAIQPGLSYSNGGFTVGTWGSYSTGFSTSGAEEELDLYVSYGLETGGGTFSVAVWDYYFPGSSNFLDYSSAEEGGAHTIEPSVSYTGPEAFPISLTAAIFTYGSANNPIWLEASYPFSVEDVDMSIAIGGTPSDEDGAFGVAGGDSDTGLTKLSISASKSIEITDSFSLPISGSYYVNPYKAESYFVFGVSL